MADEAGTCERAETNTIFKFGKLNGKPFSEASQRYINWGYIQNDGFIKCFKEDEIKINNFKDFKNYCDEEIHNCKIEFGKFKDTTFKDLHEKNNDYCLWVLSLTVNDKSNMNLQALQKYIKHRIELLVQLSSVHETDEQLENFSTELQ